MARYTAARVGGPAEALLEIYSIDELVRACQLIWQDDLPFSIFGGGSNILVSDSGVPRVVLINRARRIRFEESHEPPSVWAESGANFGMVARQAAAKGFSGLEWAVGIPGTIGGAVVGNAGAHDGDMAGSLLVAEILHRDLDREQWSVEQLGYQYRSSVLKRSGLHGRDEGRLLGSSPSAIVLAASLHLTRSEPGEVQAKIDEYVAQRHRTQPPGASMGSMFVNPPGDYAGRLIEAAGLKGTRIGDAQISTLHGNFFVNLGEASASDVYELIQLARQTVAEKFSVDLELEVELVGEWKFNREV